MTEQHPSCEADNCSGWLHSFYILRWFISTFRMFSCFV